MNPTDRLLASLIPAMEREHYTYRKANHRFLKPFAHGRYEFSLSFDGRGGLVTVRAGFFVHFDAILRHYKRVLGHPCPWAAGATLLNAGADPWQFWLFDERFAALTPHERSGYPPEAIHPDSRIEAGARFLEDAHTGYAVPFFQRLQTYRQLADFYREFLQEGGVGRCRPSAESVVYLSLILAHRFGEEWEKIASFSRGIESAYAGRSVSPPIPKPCRITSDHTI